MGIVGNSAARRSGDCGGFAGVLDGRDCLRAFDGVRAIGSAKMSLQHLWQMSYDSHTIDILRNSKYAIPVIQSFHLFGITLLLGSMVILNLRLSGIGLGQIPMALLAKQVWRL